MNKLADCTVFVLLLGFCGNIIYDSIAARQAQAQSQAIESQYWLRKQYNYEFGRKYHRPKPNNYDKYQYNNKIELYRRCWRVKE